MKRYHQRASIVSRGAGVREEVSQRPAAAAWRARKCGVSGGNKAASLAAAWWRRAKSPTVVVKKMSARLGVTFGGGNLCCMTMYETNREIMPACAGEWQCVAAWRGGRAWLEHRRLVVHGVGC